MKEPELTKPQIIITAISSILGFFALFGVALYWLVEQSVSGNQSAAMLLTGILIFITVFVVLVVILSLIWGISKIQQSAARSNMELMKINAIENQQIMNDVQKGLLLQTQTQRQQSASDVQTVRLLEMLSKVQQPETTNGRFLNNGANIIDNAFGELDE